MTERRYKPSQTAKMIIDPYEEDQNIFTVYPQLKEVAEPFSLDIIWHKYFRYLSFVYDPNSPMVREYQQVEKRKLAAADEVGYEGDHYHSIAVEFIKKVVRSNSWTLYCNMVFVFNEYTDKLNRIIDDEGLDPDKVLKAVEMKNKMINQQMEMMPRMDELYKRIFDDDREMEDAERGIVNFTPENVARHIKK